MFKQSFWCSKQVNWPKCGAPLNNSSKGIINNELIMLINFAAQDIPIEFNVVFVPVCFNVFNERQQNVGQLKVEVSSTGR